VQYGFAVDTGEPDRTAELYTEDTVFDVDGRNIMRGREAVRNLVLGDFHQSLLPNCAHTIGPAVVAVDGDRAVATGYSRIYLKTGDNINLFRIGCNRWELVKQDGAWQIAHRTSRMLGEAEAQDVLRRGI